MRAGDRPHRIRIPKRCPDCGESVRAADDQGDDYDLRRHARTGNYLCDPEKVPPIVSVHRLFGPRLRLPERPEYDPAFP